MRMVRHTQGRVTPNPHPGVVRALSQAVTLLWLLLRRTEQGGNRDVGSQPPV